MFAIIAAVIFLVGFLLHVAGNDKWLWDLLFLGLAAVALHLVWSLTPWRR